MDPDKTMEFVDANFEEHFVKPLSEFIEIPNLSPNFDQEFLENGLIFKAVELVQSWAEGLEIPGLATHVSTEEGRSPLLIISIEGERPGNIMIYGHLDKQPHMEGWMEGTGPTVPAVIDGKLYGRGSADDGYVAFMALLAI